MAFSGRRLATAAAAALSVSCRAAAQTPSPDDSGGLPDASGIPLFLAVFGPVFFIMLFLACVRMFGPPENGVFAAGSDSTGSGGPRRGETGLDAPAIAALPLVFYRDVKEHRIRDGCAAALECAVCLLEFDDDDALRLLPTCPHVFHPDCIGLWLARHVTCPLCRASLLEPRAAAPPQPEEETVAVAPAEDLPEYATVVLVDASGSDNEEEGRTKDEAVEFQWLANMRRAQLSAGRSLPRSNSTGHERAGMGRFALLLPEHVRTEILMSQKLRHVTSAVASVRVREGSSRGGSVTGIQSTAWERLPPFVARVLSRLAPPGIGGKGEDDRSGKGSLRGRREGSSRGGGVGDEGAMREWRSV